MFHISKKKHISRVPRRRRDTVQYAEGCGSAGILGVPASAQPMRFFKEDEPSKNRGLINE